MSYEYIKHRLTWLDRLKLRVGIHVHNKQFFVVGHVCLVKCIECGDESLPWEVPLRMRDQVSADHRDDVTELVKIEKRLREKAT